MTFNIFASSCLNTIFSRTILIPYFTVCTPIGFIRLFGVVGQVLVKPHLLRDVHEEFQAFNLEEASVMRKIAGNKNKGFSFFRKYYFKRFFLSIIKFYFKVSMTLQHHPRKFHR